MGGARAIVLAATLVVATLALVGAVPAAGTSHGPVDVDPADLPGSGTASDPYRISNASELQAMADDRDASYALAADVDASGTASWNGGAGFQPIGDGTTPFTGSFDGRGHEISGLTIDRAAGFSDGVGLFGTTGAATIENVGVVDASVSASKAGPNDEPAGAGIVVGSYQGVTSLTHVYATGTVGGVETPVGGLVGSDGAQQASGEVELHVSESWADVTITGGEEVGGLAGKSGVSLNANLDASNVIADSHAVGEVQGATGHIGGLVGFSSNTDVSRSYAAVDLTAPSGPDVVQKGGLVGGASSTDVADAYWDTQVSGQSTTAGSLTDVQGLTTAEMLGEAARTNMSALAFGDTWTTRPGDYPTLAFFVPAPPTATDDSYSADAGSTLTVDAPGVLANDADPNGDPLSASLVGGPSDGTLSLSADGSFTYQPNAGFGGTDSFTYEVSDGEDGTAQATATIDVRTNLRSIAYNETKAGEIDDGDPTGFRGHYEPVSFDGTAGDVVRITMTSSEDTYLVLLDPEGNRIAENDDDAGLENSLNSRISDFTLPANGTYTIVATSFGSSDTFAYDLTLERTGRNTDEDGGQSDLRSIAYNETKAGEIDDGDPTGFRGHYEPVTFEGSAGDVVDVTMQSSGDTYLFLLDPGDQVIAENDDHPDLVDFNSRIEGATLPTNGTYTVVATSFGSSATFAYDLTLERTGRVGGTDLRSIAYNETRAGEIDGLDPQDSRFDGHHEPVTFDGSIGDVVTITMTAPGDTELFLLGPDGTELARNEDAAGLADPENSRIGNVTLPANGTYTVVAASVDAGATFEYDLALERTGRVTDAEAIDLRSIEPGETRAGQIDVYDPHNETLGGFHEPVTFRGSDGDAVTITMAAPEPAVLALLGPDGGLLAAGLDGEGGLLVPTEPGEPEEPGGSGETDVASGSRIVNATLPANGTYTVVAGSLEQGATFEYDLGLVLNVSVNYPPTAVDDSYAVDEDGSLTRAATDGVLANDGDVDGLVRSAAVVDGPANGTLTLATNGSFAYVPDPDFAGTDAFTYEASDGEGGTDRATATIAVDPVNDPPVARNDTYDSTSGERLSVPAADGVLANDTDVDGDALSAAVVDGPASGTLSLRGNGSLTYEPADGFEGTDAFTYRASDGTANATATVRIAVGADPAVSSGGGGGGGGGGGDFLGSSVGVRDVSIEDAEIEPGESVAVTVTLSNDGTSGTAHVATLRIDGEVVDRRSVFLPAGETRTVEFTHTFEQPGEYALAVGDADPRTISVADDEQATQSRPSTPARTANVPPETEAAPAPSVDGGGSPTSADGGVDLTPIGLALAALAATVAAMVGFLRWRGI